MTVFTKDNIEIECTPEEFVKLMKAGVFGDTIADKAATPRSPAPRMPQVTPGQYPDPKTHDPYHPESYKDWLMKHPVVTAYGVDSIQVVPVHGYHSHMPCEDIRYTGEVTDNLQQFFGKPGEKTVELHHDTEPEAPAEGHDDKKTES